MLGEKLYVELLQMSIVSRVRCRELKQSVIAEREEEEQGSMYVHFPLRRAATDPCPSCHCQSHK